MTPIAGTCDPAFREARDAFERCFSVLGETGAAVCVYVDGRPVVDLWGGHAGAPAHDAWTPDTLVHVYSVTKPFVATCLLVLIGRGEVELDAPVARYWPEFAQAGKGSVTVRHVLTHQAGVLALRATRPREVIFDWDRVCGLLAAEEPWWPPGTRTGEHALFFGHLAGEIVRRVAGVTPGEFLRRELAGPWSLDFHIGLTSDEEQRTAHVYGIDAAWRESLGALPGTLYAQALDNPPAALHADVVNSHEWRAAQVPAVNGHGSARAIARFYAGMAAGGELEGVRILPADLVEEAIAVQASGEDVLLGQPVDWGLGFQVDADGFGMGGIGGSLGWGNAKHRFGFAYVTNRMGTHDRALAVFEAVGRIVGLPVVI